MKKLLFLAMLTASLAAVGCSGGQDVGDAEKDPPKGSVSSPTSPAPAGGSGTQGTSQATGVKD